MDYALLRTMIEQDSIDNGADTTFAPTKDGNGCKVTCLQDDQEGTYLVPDREILIQEVLEKMHDEELDLKSKSDVSDVFWNIMNTKYIDE